MTHRAQAAEVIEGFRALLEDLLEENARLRTQNETFRDLLMITQRGGSVIVDGPRRIFRRICRTCHLEFEATHGATRICTACKGKSTTAVQPAAPESPEMPARDIG
jgi:hypothetical protein